MPFTAGRVLRFLHTAQDDPGKHGFLGSALHLLQKVPNLGGVDIALSRFENIAEAFYQLRQLLHFLSCRDAVHAVDGRDLQVGAVSGHRLVGQQHEILNEVRSGRSLPQGDVDRLARLIQSDLGFREIEVNTASLFPLFL